MVCLFPLKCALELATKDIKVTKAIEDTKDMAIKVTKDTKDLRYIAGNAPQWVRLLL